MSETAVRPRPRVARFVRPGDDMRIDALFIIPGRWPRHLVNIWLG